jgi:hypothetical protein
VAAPQSLTKAIQNAVWSVDKDIAANKVETLDQYLDYWQSQRKFNTLLLAIFAGLALTLAMMGLSEPRRPKSGNLCCCRA